MVRPNQVWSTDITYIRRARGFVYLVAIIDGYSRRVLSWRIRNISGRRLPGRGAAHGKPEIFNSDQGAQFTSETFTGVLKREGIVISMDGRGRAFDNIAVEALAQRQARGRVSEGLCHDGRTDARPDGVFHLLQRRTTVPVAGSTNVGCRVSDSDRRRGDDPGQVQVKGESKAKSKAKPGQLHSAASEVECQT